MKPIKKASVLKNVCYDIRGPALQEAARLEADGVKILRLNIGNTAPFGLDTPDELIQDLIKNVRSAQGYSDSKGIFSARKAVVQEWQQRGMDISIEDVYMGNGVSELIKVAVEALLNNGDEVLVPAPDYPLWTASVNLARGKPVHYLCDEKSGWLPDMADLKKKVGPKTKAIVIINPNNPTGAVYPKETIEGLVRFAEEHNLIIMSDEIYDKILYDNMAHYSPACCTDKTLVITFSGLSKVYRAPGFRCGWMVISGAKEAARDYIEGINMLTSMRLCANVLAQNTVQTALGGRQSIYDLTRPGGRLERQRTLAWEMLNQIPGVSCVKPTGALYMFPKLDKKMYPFKSDMDFLLGLLREEHVLVVQGTGFNWPDTDHFRLVFLPEEEQLKQAVEGIGRYLGSVARI
ncbi:MAG TPA: pyridoxal phosphate-dependent aminotransferase [Spirochaetota bacterium]|nr:pyridoxal phosphate-dependent aminotransferase [Spirochaetota bacterium]HPN81863.1 pyridoxal phosphate-dependent aminotransferase [Spirochaetota bacterium]